MCVCCSATISTIYAVICYNEKEIFVVKTTVCVILPQLVRCVVHAAVLLYSSMWHHALYVGLNLKEKTELGYVRPKKMCVSGYPTVPDFFMPKSADPEFFITFIHENIHIFGKFMIFKII